MRLRAGALAIGLLFCSVASAQPPEDAAPPPTDREARGLFLAGEAAYDRGEFGAALDYFQRAFDLSQRPQLLFNVGLAASRAGDIARARAAFQRYLDEVPDAPNRGDVEARIAELEAEGPREQQSVARAEPVAPADAPSGPGPLPWIVVAGSGAIAIAGAVLLALAMSDIAAVEDAKVGADWDDVRNGYDRSPLMSGLGIGMIAAGAVGVGVGIALFASSGGDESAELAVGPSGVVLRGRF